MIGRKILILNSIVIFFLGGCAKIPVGAVKNPHPLSEIEYAIEYNSRGLWDEMISNGGNVNGYSQSVFRYAFNNQARDIAYYSISHGLEISYDDFFWYFSKISYNREWRKFCDAFLSAGYDINYKNEQGDTILDFFLKGKYLKSNNAFDATGKIEYLLENGYVISETTWNLIMKTQHCHYKAAKELSRLYKQNHDGIIESVIEGLFLGNLKWVQEHLEKEYPNLSEEEKDQIIFFAAAFGNADILEALSEQNMELFSKKDARKNTLLMIAAETGNKETFEYLLGKQSEQSMNQDEETLLQKSFLGGNDYIIKTARQLSNDDINYLIQYEGSAHDIMSRYLYSGRPYVIEWISDSSNSFPERVKEQLFVSTIKTESTSLLQQLLLIEEMCNYLGNIDNYAEIFSYVATKEQADILLHNCTAPQSDEMAYALSRIIRMDGRGIEADDLGIIEVCHKYGVKFTCQLYSPSPLIVASELGKADVVQLLINYGVGVDRVDKSKGRRLTALMAAATSSNEVLKVVLENGADVEVKDDMGQTALFYAIKSYRENNVRTLLNYGAEKSVENKERKKPYDIAREKGFKEIADILK